ncbi:MAG: electron transfer flavoprotein subunit beta/FixA family protein [Chloroflexota bacterium]
MEIIVLVKQIHDPTKLRVSRQGRLVTAGVPLIINPDDLRALEEALKLKDSLGARVTVLSLGPPEAEEALREALAMGADRAYLLSDPAFADPDALATTYALGSAIHRIGLPDLILAGQLSGHGTNAQVGPRLAECLGYPQVTNVSALEIDNGSVLAKRVLEDSYLEVEVALPALVTVNSAANLPRLPHGARIMNAYQEPPGSEKFVVWTAQDLGLEPQKVGAAGSATQIRASTVPEPKGPPEMLTGSPQEQARALVGRLRAKNLV